MNNSPFGILTGYEIRLHRIIWRQGKSIDDRIYDIDERSYSNASFDFTLDDEYYMPDGEDKFRKCSEGLGLLKIPAYTSVIVGTYENVSLPNTVAGRFDLRITWAIAGLVFQAGTQIEPGYDGKLFCVLHNLSNKLIEIPTGDYKNALLTAEFHYVSEPSAPKKTQRDNLYRIQDFVQRGVIQGSLLDLFNDAKKEAQNITEVANRLQKDVDKELKTVTDLVGEVKKLKEDVMSTRESNLTSTLHLGESRISRTIQVYSFWMIGLSLVLSIALPLVITKATYDKDDTPIQQVYELRDSLAKKNKIIDDKMTEIDSLVKKYKK